MNTFLTFLLIGFGAGLIIFPICLWIFVKFRNTFERRRIKIAIKKGQFLKPIDAKDFNAEAWKNQITLNPDDLKNLNIKLFRKSKETVDDVFFLKISNYIKEARKMGYNEEQITEEFRKKGYTEDLINKIYELNPVTING